VDDKKKELQQRTKRVNYLRQKALFYLSGDHPNTEQAGAYCDRINKHKAKILDLLGGNHE